MKKVIPQIFIILGMVLLLSTCKKYPEGGYHFNFLKKLDGQWKLKLYEVNGIDSTTLTQGATYIPNYLDDFASFAIVHSGKRAEIRMKNHYHGYSVIFNNNKRDMLSIHDDGDRDQFDSTGCLKNNTQLCQRNVFIPTTDRIFSWKIEKFTKKELILLSVIYNYKIILIK